MSKGIHRLIGSRVREERLRAGLTLEALAERADISRSFLAYIETQGRKASLDTLERLAEALDLPLVEFFRDAPSTKAGRGYDATRQFAQLIRDKSDAETATILEIVRAAVGRSGRPRKAR